MLTLAFHRLNPNATLPTKAYQGDAGIDFYALYDINLIPLHKTTISTGIAAIIPTGYSLIVFDRSSMGARGIHHLAGVIDEQYHGEIFITLINLNPHESQYISSGTKIAQALLLPVPNITIIEHTGPLPTTARGTKGHGSSG